MSSDGDPMNDNLNVPLDFIAISRSILHWANLGTPRLQFLTEVSRLLIEFSGSDLLQIRCLGTNLSYRWTYRARPEEKSCFESIEGQGAKESADCIAEALALSEIEPSAPCMTRQGSFWTGDAADALGRFGAEHLVSAGQCLESTRSLLLIPFKIEGGERAYLLLGSQHRDFFGYKAIELLETLAQTLSQAIADRRSHAALRERVKELSCLYSISQINADPDQSINERLHQIAKQLPVAWQYPENAVAQIILDNQCFSTGAFDATRFRQSAHITVAGRIRGCVEIGYVDDQPEFIEGPFLREEQNLIDAVARQLSLFVERNELQSRREELEEQLRHADRLAMIGKLAAGVAHEINEPLVSILGFAQLLQKEEMPEGQRKDLAKIITGGLHAREIVRKLVLFARQEPMKKGPVNLNDVIHESLAMLEAKCAGSQVQVDLKLADDLPRIVGDNVQLRQVVLNLMINAIQAMPDGGRLKLDSSYRDGDVVLLAQDTGVGMADDVKQKLFTPFFTTKDVGEGTGLGLSVVHGIVAAHGGTIDVTSELGSGTCFEVRLPAESSEDPTLRGVSQGG